MTARRALVVVLLVMSAGWLVPAGVPGVTDTDRAPTTGPAPEPSSAVARAERGYGLLDPLVTSLKQVRDALSRPAFEDPVREPRPTGSHSSGTRIARRTIGWPAVLADILNALADILRRAGLIGLFSRITASRILDHPSRRRVLDAVRVRPGSHVNELARRLDMNRKTLRHHLRKLEAAGRVVLEREGHLLRVQPIPRPSTARPPESPARERVLAALNPGETVLRRVLAERLGVTPQAVSHHAEHLFRAGLIRKLQYGRHRAYRLAGPDCKHTGEKGDARARRPESA